MPGFAKPTTTQTPDALLDYWLSRLTGAELRVALYAVRRTYGFGRDEDAIALDQFLHGITTRDGTVLDEGIGVSRRALLYAIKSLGEKGLLQKARQIDREGRDTTSTYRLSIVDERHPRPRAAYGLREVNTTQVPDEVFDYWLPRLSDAELKVLLYIVRRTLGFKKAADAIKPDQFLTGIETTGGVRLDDGCGLSEKHLYRAISGLKEKGLIAVERRVSARVGHLASVYTLIFENEAPALLRVVGDPDPRLRDYRDEVEPERPRSLPAQGAPWVSPDSTAATSSRVQKRRIAGAKRSGGGVQKGPVEGASASGWGRNEDRKGYASKVASQQADLSKDSQHTERQQTDDIESIGHASRLIVSDHERLASSEGKLTLPDEVVERRIIAVVTEFGDTASPRASATKAVRWFHASECGADDFVALIDEAAAVVRRYRPMKPIPYFFTTLDGLVRDTLAAQGNLIADEQPGDLPPITDTHPVWRAVLEEVRLTMTVENFNLWFASTQAVGQDGDVLRVLVPTPFAKEWLAHKLQGQVSGALARRGYAHLRVDYVVAPLDEPDARPSNRGP